MSRNVLPSTDTKQLHRNEHERLSVITCLLLTGNNLFQIRYFFRLFMHIFQLIRYIICKDIPFTLVSDRKVLLVVRNLSA
jgi:hypothetical protein